jgi:hypothetical protein
VGGEEAPCLLVVDELWLTLRSPEGGQFLESIARKGPKYWLGLVCASQEPADCLKSPQGQALVDNSSTRILLAMDTVALETAAEAFALTPRERACLQTATPGLALILCAGTRQFVHVVASNYERQLYSTTPAELAERNRRRRQAPGQQPAAVATPARAPLAGPDTPVSVWSADWSHQ